jgi:hypothetical protein
MAPCRKQGRSSSQRIDFVARLHSVLFRESIVVLHIQSNNESKKITRYNKDVLEITLIVVTFSTKKILCIEAVTNVALRDLASRRSISALALG